MTQDSIIEREISEYVAYLERKHESTGQLPPEFVDQDAASLRETMIGILGGRPITDDMMLGFIIGAISMQASFTECEQHGGTLYAGALVPAFVTMHVVRAQKLRDGISLGDFSEFERAVGSAA